MASLIVRPAVPSEYEFLGELVVEAYRALRTTPSSGGYESELRAVARRAVEAVVLVAVNGPDGAGEPIGCVTYVGDPASPWAESLEPGEAGIRMLAVAPSLQRQGAGETLTRACIDRARDEGLRAVFLHSTPWMDAAHRLYGRLGFVRVPERDWTPVPDVPLLAFSLGL